MNNRPLLWQRVLGGSAVLVCVWARAKDPRAWSYSSTHIPEYVGDERWRFGWTRYPGPVLGRLRLG